MIDINNIDTLQNIIIILIGLLLGSIIMNVQYACSDNKETFCTCQEAVTKRCPSPEVLTDLYNRGILTEYTDLVNNGWKSVMPYDNFEKNEI